MSSFIGRTPGQKQLFKPSRVDLIERGLKRTLGNKLIMEIEALKQTRGMSRVEAILFLSKNGANSGKNRGAPLEDVDGNK
jgi:hypothetical protein